MLNKKGDEGSPFILVVGAIMGLLILTIVISAITYFDSIKIKRSFEALQEGFREAVDNLQTSGSQQFIVRDNLLLEGISFSTKALALETEVKPECIKFETHNSLVNVKDNIVSIEKRVLIKVFFQCIIVTNSANTNCDICCVVSFGAQPENFSC